MKKVTNFTNNKGNANKKESFYIPLSNGQIYYSMQVLSYSADGNMKWYNLSGGQIGNIYQKP